MVKRGRDVERVILVLRVENNDIGASHSPTSDHCFWVLASNGDARGLYKIAAVTAAATVTPYALQRCCSACR
jgi:hypothetical protein